MIRIEITVIADTGSGKSVTFTGTRMGGGDNPSYYSHETWERGGALLTELVADVERQCGVMPPGHEREPSTLTKPHAPTCPAWQANNFHQWTPGETIPIPPNKYMCRETGARVGGDREVCALTPHQSTVPHVFAIGGEVTRVGR